MQRFLSFFKRTPEQGSVFLETPVDSSIEQLSPDNFITHARQLMTLSRRRRCAGEHMGALSPFSERSDINSSVISWYMHHGLKQEQAFNEIEIDFNALMHDPSSVSPIFKSKITPLVDESDEYFFGEINPLYFDGRYGTISLRETLSDRMDFAKRVSMVMSFDPEVKGHKNQIRYFRALLVSFSMAEILKTKTKDKECLSDVMILLKDNEALDNGWKQTDSRLKKESVDPLSFIPDESLLYSEGKVQESAILFSLYANRLLLGNLK